LASATPEDARPLVFRPQASRDGGSDFAFTALPPLSLYIHIPWCIRKCPYCDFNSHESGNRIPDAEDYIEALTRDLEQELPAVWGRTIDSIFIGGGTPSLLSPNSIDALLSMVRARLPLRPGLEVTMEANPGTFERGRFIAYREAGINRLSIGVQSFDAEHLKRIGRVHGPAEAVMACREAAEAGFSGWNIDLMFGLPDQDPEAALSDLNQAIELAPGHISHYQLTLEPNTAFQHKPPPLPDEETLWLIQTQGQRVLRDAGYDQYEVSAYARRGRHCHHNRNYWGFGDYIGIGAGAHGKISIASEQRILRYSKQRLPETFMSTAGTSECAVNPHYPNEADTIFEFMMNAFRLNEGFTWEQFRNRTGLLNTHIVGPLLDEARRRGLIETAHDAIRASELGRRHLNDLLMIFLSDAQPPEEDR